MILLNNIKAQPGATTARKRLGRGAGSGLGMTAGKGDKGQLARSGGKVRTGFEGGQTPLYRRLAKRGFNNFARNESVEVNLNELQKLGSVKEASMATLKTAGVIKGRPQKLVILGKGEVKQALTVKAHKVSATAVEKIEKAGGKVEILTFSKYVRPKRARKK